MMGMGGRGGGVEGWGVVGTREQGERNLCPSICIYNSVSASSEQVKTW